MEGGRREGGRGWGGQWEGLTGGQSTRAKKGNKPDWPAWREH